MTNKFAKKYNYINNGYVGGDAENGLLGNAVGGADSISIGSLSGGSVGGDVGNDMLMRSVGGADSISIGSMSDGFVGGDAAISLGDVKGKATVGGDAGRNIYGNAKGGHDSIIVIGNLSGSSLAGDAGNEMWGNGQGGNDTITVEGTMSGLIFGDAWVAQSEGVKGGDYLIIVNNFQAGSIYGDFANSIASGGDDTIVIKNLSGSGTRLIDGGSGNDLFIYDNAAGNKISLQDDGSVLINSGISGTSIINFEGIGGGSGNDTPIGNSGNYNSFADFVADWESSGKSQEVLHELLQQMIINQL